MSLFLYHCCILLEIKLTTTTITVCATKNLTVFVANSPQCLEWSRMAAVSRALRELSTRRIFFIEIQQQGIILAPMCLCEGKMWKSNVKNICHIPCRPVGVSTGQNTWYAGTNYDCWLLNHLPHMPAHSRQSERQYIIARTHTWQQYSISTSEAILTTKYGFNLRQNSPLNIENNKGYSGWIHVSVAHALIGPQLSLKLAHFCSDISWFPPQLFRYIPLHDLKRAGEKVLYATVPTSLPGDHCQVESPARGYCAKNNAYVNKAG